MRKPLATLPLAVLAVGAAAMLAFPPARAQMVDPGITAIVNAIKGTLTATISGTVTTTPAPATGNGWTPVLASGLTTTVVTVKNSAGELGAYHCLNPNVAAAYVQIFDTSGTVTLGVTVPVLSLGIPASDGGNIEWTMGVHFANAIKVAATTAATNAVAPGTAIDCNFAYK
jgi:hypothetical protein